MIKQGIAQIYNNTARTITGSGNLVLDNDQIINCDTSLGVVDLTLLEIPEKFYTGYKLYVIDQSGNAATNNITIIAPVGHLINGESQVIINKNYGNLVIRFVNESSYSAVGTLVIPASVNIYNADGTLTDLLRTADLNSGILQFTNGEVNIIGETSDDITYSFKIKQSTGKNYAEFINSGKIKLGGEFLHPALTTGSNNLSTTSVVTINGERRFVGINSNYTTDDTTFRVNAGGRSRDDGGGAFRHIFVAESHNQGVGFFVRNANFDVSGNRGNFTVFSNTKGSSALSGRSGDAGIWYIADWEEEKFKNFSGNAQLRKFGLGGIGGQSCYLEGFHNIKSYLPSAHPGNTTGSNVTAPDMLYWYDGTFGALGGYIKLSSGKYNPDTNQIDGVAVTTSNPNIYTEHPMSPYLELVSQDRSNSNNTNFGQVIGDDYFTVETKINTHGHSYLNVAYGTVNGGGVSAFSEGGRFNVGIGTKTPSAKLHVVGSDATSSNFALKVQNSVLNNLLSVANDGLVSVNGIATAVETTVKLQVNSGDIALGTVNSSLWFKDSPVSFPSMRLNVNNGTFKLTQSGAGDLLYYYASDNGSGYTTGLYIPQNSRIRFGGDASWGSYSSGDYLTIRPFAGGTNIANIYNSSDSSVLRVTESGYNVLKANDGAIVDGAIDNSEMSFYIDEAGNNLICKVKYSTGTVKTATVALV